MLGQILHHVADQVTQMPLVYDVEPTSDRQPLVYVAARNIPRVRTQAWNSHEWAVK